MNQQNIKTWVSLDNDIKILNEKLNVLRKERNKVRNEIFDSIDEERLLKSSIKISDGILKFQTIRTREPLTFKYIENQLSSIFKNKNTLESVLSHLKNNRKINEQNEIKRVTYNN